MNAILQSALAAAALAASFAAAATEDHRRPDGRRHDGPPAVYGHAPRHDIDSRQARQEWRIRQALQRGDLTRREFRMLRHEQNEIARYEAQAQRDGRIGWREQRALHDMLDRADEHIRRFARNDVERWER